MLTYALATLRRGEEVYHVNGQYITYYSSLALELATLGMIKPLLYARERSLRSL
jgi:hypothetical protein